MTAASATSRYIYNCVNISSNFEILMQRYILKCYGTVTNVVSFPVSLTFPHDLICLVEYFVWYHSSCMPAGLLYYKSSLHPLHLRSSSPTLRAALQCGIYPTATFSTVTRLQSLCWCMPAPLPPSFSSPGGWWGSRCS